MTTQTKLCQCSKPATQLVMLKGYEVVLCTKHVEQLEQLLGEKLEPLTRNYEPQELAFAI